MLSLNGFEIEALRLSLKVALWSVSLSLPVGFGVAWILARKHFPGKILLDGLVHLPLILPPVVIGYLLLVLLGRQGIIGKWLFDVFNISVAFTWRGAAISASVMAFPLMVRAIRLSLDAIDPKLENIGRTLGAGPFLVFLTVTLPLAAPGIISGAILAFARSIGEFGATITFVSNIPGATQTLPLALYNLLQIPGGEQGALRLVILSIILAASALIASELLARRLKK
ncbi:MAG: molybdate ABC transporter permease [Rhodospirillaceae bacterium TMED8]|nr:molybdate ABC transporter permease subunit [Magnetovibrio sp.]OUT49641.1 MAG: molybdate ABC transporter permease [Rhodospirillaceae bacterium TMED8]|tara:strand:+ start:343 stop:1023 length:681 start_codon:yes stop_codon:yes gene_type:complete